MNANEYFSLRQLQERQKRTGETITEGRHSARCPNATEYDRQARVRAGNRRIQQFNGFQGKAGEPGDAASAPIMPK